MKNRIVGDDMYCEKCGDKVEKDELYCNNCGNYLGNRTNNNNYWRI